MSNVSTGKYYLDFFIEIEKHFKNMELFTIDNVGETELLERNTNKNNSVKFESKLDVFNENQTAEVKDATEVEEEDENLSDVDFGGK